MLSAINLTCIRGGRDLFKNISFTLNKGECLYLRGDNGSGKTSLLRLLTGLATPNNGNVEWNNQALNDNDNFYQDLLYLGHNSMIKDELTIIENIKIQAKLNSLDIDFYTIKQALDYFGLYQYANLFARQLSAGQKRRVLLTKLITEPRKLWLLDEPFTALDHQVINNLVSLLQKHLKNSGLLIITSHQPIEFGLINYKELVL